MTSSPPTPYTLNAGCCHRPLPSPHSFPSPLQRSVLSIQAPFDQLGHFQQTRKDQAAQEFSLAILSTPSSSLQLAACSLNAGSNHTSPPLHPSICASSALLYLIGTGNVQPAWSYSTRLEKTRRHRILSRHPLYPFIFSSTCVLLSQRRLNHTSPPLRPSICVSSALLCFIGTGTVQPAWSFSTDSRRPGGIGTSLAILSNLFIFNFVF